MNVGTLLLPSMKTVLAVAACLYMSIVVDHAAYAADPLMSFQPMATLEVRFGGPRQTCQSDAVMMVGLEMQARLSSDTADAVTRRLLSAKIAATIDGEVLSFKNSAEFCQHVLRRYAEQYA